MKLEKLLSQKRSAVLKGWLDNILETYPAYSNRFLKKQKDQFANPVRYTFAHELEKLFDELVRENRIDIEVITPVLDSIIRIRAVQDFSASQAVAFIFLLKGVIREELGEDIREDELEMELLSFESRIDDMTLIAFDVYMSCREEIYKIRANQANNHVSGLLRRAGLTCEIPEWDSYPDAENDNHQVTS
jgi:hypothetical protein